MSPGGEQLVVDWGRFAPSLHFGYLGEVRTINARIRNPVARGTAEQKPPKELILTYSGLLRLNDTHGDDGERDRRPSEGCRANQNFKIGRS